MGAPDDGGGGQLRALAPPEVFDTIPHLQALIALDYVVAATDYPGLGTPGPHPYLVGESEGRAVIDSVRAARDLEKVGASTRYAVWGHSQGGQAALFAGEIATDLRSRARPRRRGRHCSRDRARAAARRRHCRAGRPA